MTLAWAFIAFCFGTLIGAVATAVTIERLDCDALNARLNTPDTDGD